MVETEYKYDVFISYSHKDEPWVRTTLLPALEKRALKVCIDFRDFIAGRVAILNMTDASKNSRHTLLVLTSNWVQSEWTMYESLLARTGDPSGLQRRTIPLLLEKCDVPDFISLITWVDFKDANREEEAWRNLFNSLRGTDGTSAEEGSDQGQLAQAVANYRADIKTQMDQSAQIENLETPYKALLEYDIRDTHWFFGRDEDARNLLRAMSGSHLTVLHSKSGSGKTSLLKARIRPHLFERGDLPVYVRPHHSPVDQAIKRAILLHQESSPAWKDMNLHDFLYEVSSHLDGKWLVIILDQFEEIFTPEAEANRKEFSQQLAACLNSDRLPLVHWLISLRGEYLSELATFDPPVNNPINNNLLLQPLNRQSAALAIREPALRKNVIYEEGLIDTILDALGPKTIHPPELQIICSALYEARGSQSLISRDLYETLGQAKGILQEHFTNVMNQRIPKDRVVLAHQVLSSLVSSQGTRVSRTREELEDWLIGQKVDVTYLADILTRLEDGHLLRVEEIKTARQATLKFELAHDYLVDKIEADPETKNRKIAQELIDYKTRYYLQNNKLLLSTEELQFVSPYLDQLDLPGKNAELVHLSQKAAEQQSNRNATRTLLTNVAGTTIALTLFSLLLRAISAFSSFITLFWGAILSFAVVGYRRGWVKELLVCFSAILGLALNLVSRKYIPIMGTLPETDVSLFWVRIIILFVLVYFGYQTVITVPLFKQRTTRESLQDSLLGLLMGAFNGYLVIGSILYYYAVADFPFTAVMGRPADPQVVQIINRLLLYLPPQLLGEPGIYFAVILAEIAVILTFVDSKAGKKTSFIASAIKRVVSRNNR